MSWRSCDYPDAVHASRGKNQECMWEHGVGADGEWWRWGMRQAEEQAQRQCTAQSIGVSRSILQMALLPLLALFQHRPSQLYAMVQQLMSSHP